MLRLAPHSLVTLLSTPSSQHPPPPCTLLSRRLDSQRVEGMDLYSTVLWHMQRERELSYLVQEMQSIDRMCPQVRRLMRRMEGSRMGVGQGNACFLCPPQQP
jgi:hypothetical protein